MKKARLYKSIFGKKNRGRFETGITSVANIQNNIPKGWPANNHIIFVQREVISKNKRYQTDSYYITDLINDDARYPAGGIRGNWYIENKLHYAKDVTMKEDQTCTKNKNAVPNPALLRDSVYNILKRKDKSIKYAADFLQTIISKNF